MLNDAQRANVTTLLGDLRSGDYTQGQSYLKRNDYGRTKHCCLGVALEGVLGKTFRLRSNNTVYEYKYGNYPGHGEACTMQTEEASAFGFHKPVTDDESFVISGLHMANVGPTRTDALMYMNDHGRTFNEIADMIEKLGWDK